MIKGVPTARTRVWQVKQAAEKGSDVYRPVLAQFHHRALNSAFNTLDTILQAALVIAQ
jgi:hypothetical protein